MLFLSLHLWSKTFFFAVLRDFCRHFINNHYSIWSFIFASLCDGLNAFIPEFSVHHFYGNATEMYANYIDRIYS
jgi:hypothetical protein